MAENNQRSYRDPRWRSAEEAPHAQTNDPLAELARLIGQNVPMDRPGRDRKSAAPRRADDQPRDNKRDANYPTRETEVYREPLDEKYSAHNDGSYRRDPDDEYRAGEHERYEPVAESEPTPRVSRFFGLVRSYGAQEAHAGAGDEAARDAADWRDQPADEAETQYADEYEDEGHDADEHGYDDDYSEDPNTSRRGSFVFVAAVFALAVLGAAGAFGYRAMFGSPALPSLPPIIKAEGGPNKIIPSGGHAQDSAGRDNAGSGERVVSREERPVDIPRPVASTAPRSVATVPVFPDPPAMGGPGAVVGYSARPSLSNAASAAEPPPAPSAPVMTAATAPNLASSTAQASPPMAVPPPSTASSGVPGAAAPKKIRTVTIRSDQSGAPEGPASASANQANAQRPGAQSQGPNGPLSLVPSSPDAPASAPPRPRTIAPQPAPLHKPPANDTASIAPVTNASGGYAVQVSSQHSEEEAQSSFRALQAKYPDLLGGREPMIRRADLGAKGIYFRTMVGPFASADQANELCSNLKAAGGSCIVQKN